MDFGQRSNVDLITSGMATRSDNQAKEAEMNRVLHPANQKWLEAIRSGRMTPAEAAVAAHAEHDQMGTPHVNTPPQGMAPPPGSQSGQPPMQGRPPMPMGGGMSGPPQGEGDRTVVVPLPRDSNWNANGSDGGYHMQRPSSVNEGEMIQGNLYPKDPMGDQPEEYPPQRRPPEYNNQIQESQLGNRGGMVSAGQSQAPTSRGGSGMTAEQPFTVRDMGDAKMISSMQRPDTLGVARERGASNERVASIRGESNNTVATTKGEYGLKREGMEGEQKGLDRKEKGREFDEYLKWRYKSLENQKDIAGIIKAGKERVAQIGATDKVGAENLKMDVGLLEKIHARVTQLQNELVRDGAMGIKGIDPEQKAKTIEMIEEFQRQAADLSLSIHHQMQERGGRGALNNVPGSKNPWTSGPTGVDGKPTMGPNQWRPNASGSNGRPSMGGEAPPINTDADVREPQTIQIRIRTGPNKGQVRSVPTATVQKAMEESEEEFLKMFEIAGVQDEEETPPISER